MSLFINWHAVCHEMEMKGCSANFNIHTRITWRAVKVQILIQEVWGRVQTCAILTSSQAARMLPGYSPQLEEQSYLEPVGQRNNAIPFHVNYWDLPWILLSWESLLGFEDKPFSRKSRIDQSTSHLVWLPSSFCVCVCVCIYIYIYLCVWYVCLSEAGLADMQVIAPLSQEHHYSL